MARRLGRKRRSEVKGAEELIARAVCEYPLYAYFFGGTPETRYRKALGYFLAEENFVLETHDGSKAAYYLRHGGRLVAEYDLTKSLKHSIIVFEKSLLSAEEK